MKFRNNPVNSHNSQDNCDNREYQEKVNCEFQSEFKLILLKQDFSLLAIN